MLKHHFVHSRLIEQENSINENSLQIDGIQFSTCSIRNFNRPPDGQLKNVSF